MQSYTWGEKVLERLTQNSAGNAMLPICLVIKQAAFSPTKTSSQTCLAGNYLSFPFLFTRIKSLVDINVFLTLQDKYCSGALKATELMLWLVEIWMG